MMTKAAVLGVMQLSLYQRLLSPPSRARIISFFSESEKVLPWLSLAPLSSSGSMRLMYVLFLLTRDHRHQISKISAMAMARLSSELLTMVPKSSSS
ncbi:hypothetical protein NL676_007871 [Syzygium grande]|nr:hypothetical protein NL676_007871 [Syzygium grande]